MSNVATDVQIRIQIRNNLNITFMLGILIGMVNVRCPDFDDTVWNYVAEYAKRKGISRCKALEHIVIEHMKVVAEAQKKAYEKAKKNV